MLKKDKAVKKGRPAVIEAKSMVLFRGDEYTLFNKWRQSRDVTDEERARFGIKGFELGISEAIRLAMFMGIENDTSKKSDVLKK